MVHKISQQVVLDPGSKLTMWVEVEQNNVVGLPADGASRKAYART